MSSAEQSGRAWLCKPCNMLFSSWEKLRDHKGSMRKAGHSKHIHCKFCSEDFKTERAEILHIQEKHPQEQDLECPACGSGPFVRLGGLMNHIEKYCARLDTGLVSELRQRKLEFPSKLEALTDENVKANYTEFMPSTHESDTAQWKSSDSKAKLFSLNEGDFPSLEGSSGRAANSTHPHKPSEEGTSSAWESKKLFPGALAAQPLNKEQLQQVAAPSGRAAYNALDPHDPDNPTFNSARYYSSEAEKFGCPRIGCGKMFKKATGLVGHLRSTAHVADKFRCPYCQRTFGSLTAITQHAETSSVRCNIRMADQYDAYLDQLTGGLVDVAAGSHEDGTPKYNTTEAARQEFGHEKSRGASTIARSDWGKGEETDNGW